MFINMQVWRRKQRHVVKLLRLPAYKNSVFPPRGQLRDDLLGSRTCWCQTLFAFDN